MNQGARQTRSHNRRCENTHAPTSPASGYTASMSVVLQPRTLNRVRWFGALAFALLLVAGWIGPLPRVPALVGLALIGAAAGLNGALHALGPRALGPVLVGDTLLLTVMLASSGGASNPFTLVYLFPVVLASLAASPAWTAGLALLTTAGFASLFLVGPEHVHHMDMRQHLIGMVVAYAVTVPLLGVAVHRFRAATAQAEQATLEARASSERAQRLSGLAALAGGAAHELATPLSTILLVSRELMRSARDADREDLALIAAEVDRCKRVLDELAAQAGASPGEGAEIIALDALVRGALDDPHATIDASPDVVRVPVGLVRQAIRRLAGNARDAVGSDGPIRVTARVERGALVLEVADDGPGMPEHVLSRAGEPFFTTRPGRGMGLGLFFVNGLAAQLGGSFTLRSAPGSGTVATLTLPAEPPG